VTFSHDEPPDRLSETPPAGFTGRFRDFLAAEPRPDGVDSDDRGASLRFAFDLAPGARRRFRFVRAVSREEDRPERLESVAKEALSKSEEDVVEEASRPYRTAYDLGLTDPARRMIYGSALNLARQCMLPGEGRVRYNYYVFSREPTWGWGHDGQVFHESLSMLAYALFDPRSAMDSQRIFMEAQDGDGYIRYRIGPYAVRTFPVKGERTTSAPFLSWTNWEVYRTARDLRRKGGGNVEPEEARRFLRQALGAGESFAHLWDPETRFYYNVDRATNSFTVTTGAGATIDLRRKEIIGFLPLWAGVAPPDRAQALVQHLTSPSEFRRRFGVPTLAADDAGYEPRITRCCQWNGAVWLEWNYLVFDGLRRYGYRREARELGERMIEAAATQLRRNHRFWESYSPDEETLASPMNYIWDSILARVIVDLQEDER
jgi:hypothetical protein